ncbi:response regulator [Pseudonocardia nantongensis]|uniref:response regulator n=1 Tax=Pseudonocardia nantongensis TaxID=1181885 RepID=UPI00397AF4D4
MIRVAVVDDQPLLASSFAAFLERQPDMTVAGMAGDGAQALELCRRTEVDVVLMDLRMPVLDGIEATRALSARGERPRVLVLTTFEVDEFVVAAARAGARGYLLKDAEPAELLSAVRAVHDGRAVLGGTGPSELLRAHLESGRATAPAPGGGALEHLSDREAEVLAEIASGATNAEIATRLHIAETTVKTHVGNLLTKLDCRDRVALVVLAHAVAR